jgi:hypothetical protein
MKQTAEEIAIKAIRANYDLWMKEEINDGAFSFHLHNNLLTIEKALQQPKGEWISVEAEFIKFIQDERISFCKTILQYFPHEMGEKTQMRSDIRVASENILIAYDQMAERLKAPPESPKGGKTV